MDKLLYLCHRIPYPPNKGDKVRSFQILKELSRHFEVHLGAFVDDREDWQHEAALRAYCADVRLVPLAPRRATLGSARGLLTGEPLTLPYYRSARMARWVRQTVESQGIERVLVFSSSMAQYLDALPHRPARVVVDFVDVDSAKWAAYGDRKPWPLSAVYRREGRTLARFERQVAAAADASLFVSREEADCFLAGTPELSGRVLPVANGVDTAYFDPDQASPNPFRTGEPALVFTGAMDYWPNVDAVTWFAEEVYPALQARVPGLSFVIVGARPVRTVEALTAKPGVHVTGTVPDVRPYLRHAAAAVAPLRVARGIQNKVLEALSMRCPIVVTPEAAEGLQATPALRALTAADSSALVAKLAWLLDERERAARLGAEGRRMVLEGYAWSTNLAPLLELLSGPEPLPHAEAPARSALAGTA